MKAVMQRILTVATVPVGVLMFLGPMSLGQTKFSPQRFTVVDAGTFAKPDVVLIPGLSSSRDVWAAEVKKLAPNYRVHLVQVNGFAGQPAGANAKGELLLPLVDELHAYIAATRMHPAVVGHSLGGLLTLMLAQKYPADVSKIVIVDSLPFYGLLFGPQMTPATIQPQAEQMRDGLMNGPVEAFTAQAKRAAEGMVLDPDGLKMVIANSVASDRSVFARAMYEDMQTDVRPGLPATKTATLMLYPFDPTLKFPGGPTLTPELSDAIYQGAYAGMPNVELVRVDNSRHFIMFDQPGKFDQLLEQFLK